jgi:hypothetical protein
MALRPLPLIATYSSRALRLFFLLLSGLAFSCNEPTSLGRDLIGDGDLLTALTDTFTIRTYTVASDSTYSANLISHALGSDDDAVFGRSTAGMFTQFVLPTNNLDFTPDTGSVVYVFDSLVLSLSLNSFYGDTTVPQSFSVYRVTEDLEPNTVYNSDRRFSTDPVRIGGLSGLLPRPRDSVLVGGQVQPPQLRIPLDPSFGLQLFGLAGQPELANDTSFQNWLQGLFIVPDTLAGFGRGFFQVNPRGPLSRLNLHYRAVGSTNTDTSLVVFPIGSTSVTVGHYTQQYAGSEAAPQLCGGNSSDSLCYISGLGGLAMRIEIPHLKNLGNVAINRATLRFALTGGSGSDSVFSPPGLCYLLATDSVCLKSFIFIRRIDETYWSVLDQFESATHYGGQRDKVNAGPGLPRVDGYEFNLTRQFQRILNGEAENEGFVLVPFPYFRIPNRAVIAGIQHPDERLRMKLEILYTEIE